MPNVSGLDLWQWRRDAQQRAIAATIPVSEIDWLLREVAGLDRLSLRLESFKDNPQVVLACSLAELTRLWQQRLTDRMPVQYLAGAAPWRELTLTVSPAVLIPRPETECLVDLAIAAVQTYPALGQGQWADLGTGSGAIALGLATQFPAVTVHAVDCSAEALAIAQHNAQQLNLGDRVQFDHGIWFEPLASLRGKLSGMVSNPPYIPSEMVLQLQPEVVRHEPHLALDGGADGLDCLRHLVATAPDYLQSGGVWMVEMMAGQAEAVANLLQRQGSYDKVQIYPDLAGIERFAVAYRI